MPRGRPAPLDGGASGSFQGGLCSGGSSGTSAMSYLSPTKQSQSRAGEVRDQKAEREESPIEMVQGTPQGLRKLLRGRFGSCVCGWRKALDRRGAHRLSEDAFVKALRDMGFPNAKGVFLDLGGGASGHVQLAHVDPYGAQQLDSFYRAYTEDIGPLETLTADCDSRRLNQEQFLRKCEPIRKRKGQSEPGGVKREVLEAAFHALQLGGKVGVTAEDLAWLEGFCNPPERTKIADVPLWKDTRPGVSSRRVEGAVTMAQRQAAENFRRALRRNYGGLVQAWRELLDPRKKFIVELKGLQAACEEIGFEGDVQELWDALVRPPETALKLEILEPLAPESLKAFRKCCGERFGSMAQALKSWTAAEAPIVAPREFYNFCDEVCMSRNQRMLFELLDARGAGKVSMAAVDLQAARDAFGEEACQEADEKLAELAEEAEESRGSPRARKTLRAQQQELCAAVRKDPADRPTRRQELAKKLKSRYGSVVRAWIKQFDIRAAGKISRDAFFEGCAAAGWHGSQSALSAEMELEEGAMVKFKDFAPELMEFSTEFKELAKERLTEWCGQMEKESKDPRQAAKRGVRVGKTAFKDFCIELQFEGDVDELFSCFDFECEGTVDTKMLRAFSEAKSEDKGLPRLLAKHVEKKRQQATKKMNERRLPPPADVWAKQDELRRSTQRNRANVGKEKALREEFLSWLRADSGTVTKGWKLQMDPDDFGDLDEQEFCQALSAAGFLPPESMCSDEDVSKGQELFKVLSHEAKEEDADRLVSLRDLDPATYDAVDQLKEHIKQRYGSVVQAFLEMDPEGEGTLATETFKSWCVELNCSDVLRRLLDFLDAAESGTINLEDIDEDVAEKAQELAEKRREAKELQREQDEEKGRNQFTEPPPIGVKVGVSARAEERAAAAKRKIANDLKQKLVHKYGSLLQAWRKALNVEGKWSINIHHFVRVCEKVGIPRDSSTAAWEAMGLEGTKVTFDGFDPTMKPVLKSFKASLARRYGSVEIGLETADKNKDFILNKKDFLHLCYECQWHGNEFRLFEYLDQKNSGEEVDLAFVDKPLCKRIKKKRLEEEKEKQRKERRRNKKKGIVEAEGGEAAQKTEEGKKPGEVKPPDKGKATEAPAAPAKRASFVRRHPPSHNVSSSSLGPSMPSLSQLASIGSLGSLCAGARPRMVRLHKASSLPALPSPKPIWDDRHHVAEIGNNRLENMVHKIMRVETHHNERLVSNLQTILREVPIKDWVAQQLKAWKELENAPPASGDEMMMHEGEEDEDDDW